MGLILRICFSAVVFLFGVMIVLDVVFLLGLLLFWLSVLSFVVFFCGVFWVSVCLSAESLNHFSLFFHGAPNSAYDAVQAFVSFAAIRHSLCQRPLSKIFVGSDRASLTAKWRILSAGLPVVGSMSSKHFTYTSCHSWGLTAVFLLVVVKW